jgi:hypothetical protein
LVIFRWPYRVSRYRAAYTAGLPVEQCGARPITVTRFAIPVGQPRASEPMYHHETGRVAGARLRQRPRRQPVVKIVTVTAAHFALSLYKPHYLIQKK